MRAIFVRIFVFPTVALFLFSGCGGVIECGDPVYTAAQLRSIRSCTSIDQLTLEVEPGVTAIDLPNLETVGFLAIRGGQDLERASFPALVDVDNVQVEDARQLDTLELPVLGSIGFADLSAIRLTSFEIGALMTIEDTFIFREGPETLTFPALESVDRLNLGWTAGVRHVDLPALTSATTLLLGGSLRTASLGALEDDQIEIFGGEWLEELSAPNTQGTPRLSFSSGQNLGTLMIELGPNSRPDLCFRDPSGFQTLEIKGPTTLHSLLLWQLIDLTHLEIPQITRIQTLEINAPNSLPSDEIASLRLIADVEATVSGCQH